MFNCSLHDSRSVPRPLRRVPRAPPAPPASTTPLSNLRTTLPLPPRSKAFTEPSPVAAKAAIIPPAPTTSPSPSLKTLDQRPTQCVGAPFLAFHLGHAFRFPPPLFFLPCSRGLAILPTSLCLLKRHQKPRTHSTSGLCCSPPHTTHSVHIYSLLRSLTVARLPPLPTSSRNAFSFHCAKVDSTS